VDEVSEAHVADGSDSDDKQELGKPVEAVLVMGHLLLMLLHVLEELDGVGGGVEVLFLNHLLHLLLLGGLVTMVALRRWSVF
jgi:hypothetical protein